jgi:cytochrome P450
VRGPHAALEHGYVTPHACLTGQAHGPAGLPAVARDLGDALSFIGQHRRQVLSRAGRLAEEARYLSPVQGMFRILTAPATLGGVQLPAGARMVLSFAAANRDDAVFAEAETFNPDRPNAADHLAFGQGVHYCLGAPLARLEAAIALRQIACRVSSVALAAGDDLRYQPSFLLRGLERLQLQLIPAATGLSEAMTRS